MAPAAAATASSLFLCRLPRLPLLLLFLVAFLPPPLCCCCRRRCCGCCRCYCLCCCVRLLRVNQYNGSGTALLPSASAPASLFLLSVVCCGIVRSPPGVVLYLLPTSRRRKKTTNLILAIKNKVPPTFIVLAIGRSLLSNRLLPVFHCSF